jgi:Peroxiredoxin
MESCGNSDFYSISGEIKGLVHPDLYVVTPKDSVSFHLDTISVEKGKFTYKGKTEQMQPVVIYMETGNVWITVWIKNGESISLKGDANYPELILAKGNEINDLLSEFKEENKSLIQERGDLRDKELQTQNLNDDLNLDLSDVSTSFQIKNLDLVLKNKAEDFVRLHPASVASLVLIQDYIVDMEDARSLQVYLDLLQGDAREDALYHKLKELISRKSVTAEGNLAPEFSLHTTSNDTITLDKYRGKYLLVSFVASWCQVCEADYDSLSIVRKDFSKKNMELLTVSLDENSADWEKIIEERKFDWDQVIENKGRASEIVVNYKINSLPTHYLIDKEGIIVGSGVPLTILRERLNLLLKGQYQ